MPNLQELPEHFKIHDVFHFFSSDNDRHQPVLQAQCHSQQMSEIFKSSVSCQEIPPESPSHESGSSLWVHLSSRKFCMRRHVSNRLFRVPGQGEEAISPMSCSVQVTLNMYLACGKAFWPSTGLVGVCEAQPSADSLRHQQQVTPTATSQHVFISPDLNMASMPNLLILVCKRLTILTSTMPFPCRSPMRRPGALRRERLPSCDES